MLYTGGLINTTYPTMKLRTKYVLFVTLLHLVTLVLSFIIFQNNKVFFIVSEVFILISILISWSFYNELIQPLQRLMQGIEAIKDRDFNVKFVKTGKPEMDQLLTVYNAMIDELRKERTLQEEQHFFLQKLIATSPTGIIILDFDNNIQSINEKALMFLKMQERDLIGKRVDVLEHLIFRQLNTIQPGESATINITGIDMYKLHKSQFIDRGFTRSFVMIEVMPSG